MAFKINISTSDGKTYKLEAEAPDLMQKSLGDVVQGQDVSPDLAGYELEITGASDDAGFTAMKEVEGFNRSKLLLDYGKAMHKRPKGLRKKIKDPPLGLRLRKTVRGKIINEAIVQINTKVLKEGGKKLSEVFPDQNAVAAPEPAPQDSQPDQEPKESPKALEEGTHPDQEPKQ